MSDVTRKDGGAMDTINCLPDNQYEWEWPAVFIPVGLAALLKNKKQRLQSGELVRKSRN